MAEGEELVPGNCLSWGQGLLHLRRECREDHIVPAIFSRITEKMETMLSRGLGAFWAAQDVEMHQIQSETGRDKVGPTSFNPWGPNDISVKQLKAFHMRTRERLRCNSQLKKTFCKTNLLFQTMFCVKQCFSNQWVLRTCRIFGDQNHYWCRPTGHMYYLIVGWFRTSKMPGKTPLYINPMLYEKLKVNRTVSQHWHKSCFSQHSQRRPIHAINFPESIRAICSVIVVREKTLFKHTRLLGTHRIFFATDMFFLQLFCFITYFHSI